MILLQIPRLSFNRVDRRRGDEGTIGDEEEAGDVGCCRAECCGVECCRAECCGVEG